MQPVHWFPGHMAKARREMSETLKMVDAVLELVDARLPVASANPMLRELIGVKPRVIVMTRVDLADDAQTNRWKEYFRSLGVQVIGVDSRSGAGTKLILPALESTAQAKRERDKRRGIRPRPLRTMVIGIPNVGKSSLINRFAGKPVAKTGDRPGITRTQQWIRLGNIELLDTPGVLWPKLEDQDSAYLLAVSGAVKPEVLDLPSVCAYFLLWCARRYPDLLSRRYELSELPTGAWENAASAWERVEPLVEEIARKRGLLRQGGMADTERAAELVLREVQTGIVGKMTFEWAPNSELP